MTAFKTGDLVIIDPMADARNTYLGVIFRVVECKRTKVRIQPVTRNGADASHEPVVLCPAAVLQDASAAPAAPAAPLGDLGMGAVVKVLPHGNWKEPTDKLWVVTNETGRGYSIAALNSTSRAVWNGLARAALATVSDAELAAHFAARA